MSHDTPEAISITDKAARELLASEHELIAERQREKVQEAESAFRDAIYDSLKSAGTL